LVLFIAPTAAAQYFSKLYDYDSSGDDCLDVQILSNNNYFTFGAELSTKTYQQGLQWMVISHDGDTVLYKNSISSSFGPMYKGLQGRVKLLSDGGYAVPFTMQRYKNPKTFYSVSGMVKLNKSFDTVFVRTYTDTTKYFEDVQDIIELPDKGYILVGEQADTAVSALTSILLMKIDVNGNFVWKHTYHKTAGNNERANSISLLNDGRTLVGAYTKDLIRPAPGDYYYRFTPWYLIMDTAGNFLRDTLWSSGYNWGGNVFPDKNGGYFTFGEIDTLLASPSFAIENFPDYAAHLDTNFNIQWIHRFPSDQGLDIHRYVQHVKQLNNGNYLVLGSMLYDYPATHTAERGWATVLDVNGNTVWENTYEIDTNKDCSLEDARERSDGSIILAGYGTNTSLPSWHYEDVWLVSIDSNGCEMPGCSRLAVQTVPQGAKEFSVNPNPVQDVFKVNSPGKGILMLYDINGRVIGRYKISEGANELKFPEVGSGIYTGRWVSDDGACNKMIRIVKE